MLCCVNSVEIDRADDIDEELRGFSRYAVSETKGHKPRNKMSKNSLFSADSSRGSSKRKAPKPPPMLAMQKSKDDLMQQTENPYYTELELMNLDNEVFV